MEEYSNYGSLEIQKLVHNIGQHEDELRRLSLSKTFFLMKLKEFYLEFFSEEERFEKMN